MSAIVKSPPRPSEALLDQFADYCESALLHEALGKQGALTGAFRPAWPGARLLGSALTVQGVPQDNLMLHIAISVARPRDVLVAAVNEFTEGGLWGEIATVAAQQRGVAGLLTDGAVRDTEAIARLGFPVFSRGISIKGTTKRQKGTINHPIPIGGVMVCPGDIIVGDADGVVVVPLARAERTLEAARQIRQRESEILREIKAGKLTLDLLDLRPAMRELGLEDA